MLPLHYGVMLGLWARERGRAGAGGQAGASEIAFTVADGPRSRRYTPTGASAACRIVQEPTDMDFGRTFVALDPDGHRLRVFAPAAA